MSRPKGTSTSITIADVAKAAGVATMTVSRFLNQHPNVTEKTAKKVRAAIEKLGYAPNHAARVLMGKPTNVVGLVVPNLDDAFFATVAHGVQDAARERDIFIWIAASYGDTKTEAKLINQMCQHKVDGIILVPTYGGNPTAAVGNCPIVAVDRPVEGRNVDAVVVENRRSAREAVEHLISDGYQRIACLGAEPEVFTMRERIAGYEDAVRAHALKQMVFTDCVDLASTIAVIKKLTSAPGRVEAIFTLNNLATLRVLEALDDCRIAIPRQIALIGFDDFQLAAVFKPRLTVVSQPTADLGKNAARLLFGHIDGTTTSTGMTIALPAQLIVRESCGCHKR
jgi:LacI family transcriptional regulator